MAEAPPPPPSYSAAAPPRSEAWRSDAGPHLDQHDGDWRSNSHGPASHGRSAGHDGVEDLTTGQLRSRIAALEHQQDFGSRGHQDVVSRHSPGMGHREDFHEATGHPGNAAEMQRRVQAAEQDARDAQEAARAERMQRQRLENMLKDRDGLLEHAKAMWMKESTRATKLAEALTSAENRFADQETRLVEVTDRYNEALQEVRQLRHLFDGGNGSGNGFAGLPLTAPELTTKGVTNGVGHSAASLDPTVAFSGNLGSPARGHRPVTPRSSALESALNSLPPPLEAETNLDRFRHLCMANDAVLYEDELLQVGLKSEIRDTEIQLAVYFGNKGTSTLQAFSVQFFVREEHALRLTASTIVQQLEAHDQIVQRVGARCFEPFLEPPMLRVQFLLPDASPRRLQFKFPVIMTKFLHGCELAQQEFFRIWRLQPFVLNEVSHVVPLAPRLCSALVHIARCIVFGGALRLHHGLDACADNFVLAGCVNEGIRLSADRGDPDRGFREPPRSDYGLGGHAPPASGRPAADRESSMCLVRVEVGSGRFVGKARVVVRAGDHIVARAVSDCIVAQLSVVPSMATETR